MARTFGFGMVVAFTLGTVISPCAGMADGQPIAPVATLEAGADAQYDRRLPPVYPGEEVRDGERKVKVWSSSGPVVHDIVVPTPPIPPNPPGLDQSTTQSAPNLDTLGIIIDKRGVNR